VGEVALLCGVIAILSFVAAELTFTSSCNLVFPVTSDMISEKLVETARGQALADEYAIKFFETSAKSNINVVESFTSIAADIKKRLMDNPSSGGASNQQNMSNVRLDQNQGKKDPKGCC
jgi:Ras-related protein Rab-8A